EIRWRAAYALGRIADRRAGPWLRPLLEDKDPLVRAMAARSEGDVGDSTAVSALEGLRGDAAWRGASYSRHARGGASTRPPAATLRAMLRDPHAHVRWEAAVALGAARDSSAVSALTAALQDSATGVVQGAAISLLQLRGDAAVPLIAPAMDLLPPFLR